MPEVCADSAWGDAVISIFIDAIAKIGPIVNTRAPIPGAGGLLLRWSLGRSVYGGFAMLEALF